MFSLFTILCKSEKSEQLTTRSGAPDRVRFLCLVNDTCHFSHKSDELTVQAQIKKLENENPFELGIRRELVPNHVRERPLTLRGPGEGASEAQMIKLTAANQKPLIL